MSYIKRYLGCLVLVLAVLMSAVNVNAETTSITRTGYSYANGHPESEIRTDSNIRAFCIEYGKHYANKVDDLKECTYNKKDLSEFTATNFVGWGEWAFESGSDHTLDMSTLECVNIKSSPSSRINSTEAGTINSGTKEVYEVKVTTLTDGEEGVWDSKKRIAASVAAEYIDNERCLQVVMWAIANGKITATVEGNLIYVTFSEDCDDFIVNSLDVGADIGGSTDADEDEDLSGVTDDGFLSTSRDYDTINQYRRFVWIVTNWHQIPSFASLSQWDAKKVQNRIHLKWDDTIYNGEGGYTATVNDENGVLDWYDFTNCLGSDFDITQAGDGTLTISTQKKIEGNPIVNELESVRNSMFPADGLFRSVRQLRWTLEGKTLSELGESFAYTMLEKDLESDGTMKHKHDWKCNWKCTTAYDKITNCTGSKSNCKDKDGQCGCYHCDNATNVHVHNDNCAKNYACSSCGGLNGHTTEKCTGSLTVFHSYACGNAPNNAHDCDSDCTTHKETCKHYKNCDSYNESTSASAITASPKSNCTVSWTCEKTHYKEKVDYITSARYKDWQDLIVTGKRVPIIVGEDGDDPYDPIHAYIAVVTDDDEYEAETDVDILLIAEEDSNNDLETVINGETVKHASHIKPGEMYKVRYIYTYKGASKGFYKKENQTRIVPYYYFNYKVRMLQKPLIKDIKGSYRNGDAAISIPILDIEKTNVTIKGVYTTLENGINNPGKGTGDNTYPNTTYKFSSGTTWNDTICLDAMTTDDTTDGYTPLPAMKSDENGTNRSVQRSSEHSSNVTVKKANDTIEVTWIFDSDYEVFTSPIINATGYIQVGESKNQVFTCYEEKYNYGEDTDHLNAGDDGYFGRHVIYTKNARYETYAVKNTIWQTDVEISTSNVILNTGAGITQPIYSAPGVASHRVNYNVYYTIELQNPKAHIYWDKLTKANNKAIKETEDTDEINTSNETYEFDVNTLLSWGASGNGLAPFEGTLATVDHISTGKTYLQREIPTVLTILESDSAKMTLKVNPNCDRLIYEDAYTTPTKQEKGKKRVLTITASDVHYANNEKSAESIIYPAINPVKNHPIAIVGSSDYNTTTSFKIKMGDDNVRTVYDRLKKEYTQYTYKFNTGTKDNKVIFPATRKSVTFFKYSNTNYKYNDKDVKSVVGENTTPDSNQTEKYYISQVLFKSNYTTKYQKELEKQGATFVVEEQSNGSKDVWVDMVNQNQYAIVAAGQGFEIKVTVKYENSFLTQYLARYFGTDDAQNSNIGSSALNNKTAQYCNISALTGGYINGYTALDRYVTDLVTGSNVYSDLYAYMSDNPETVYSATGMYDTPIIFDRDIEYSDDYSVTTFTYTMSASTENGVISDYQNQKFYSKKFYTNQLASDSESAGMIENGNLKDGEHSITLWTPIIAATPFDYPNAMQDRYIGDAIELGYTIKTTGADDSIVHIVQ